MRTSISSSSPRGLPAIQPLRPLHAAREQQQRGGDPRNGAAFDRLPVAVGRAAPQPGQIRQLQRLALRPDALDPHSRYAIQAYRALGDSEAQSQLSQLLGIDEYA